MIIVQSSLQSRKLPVAEPSQTRSPSQASPGSTMPLPHTDGTVVVVVVDPGTVVVVVVGSRVVEVVSTVVLVVVDPGMVVVVVPHGPWLMIIVQSSLQSR